MSNSKEQEGASTTDEDLEFDRSMIELNSEVKKFFEKWRKHKKNEAISSLASRLHSRLEEWKSKLDIESNARKSMLEEWMSDLDTKSQSIAKSLQESSKEGANLLKYQIAKIRATNDKFFMKEAAQLRDMKDIISKIEEVVERLIIPCEEQREKEMSISSL